MATSGSFHSTIDNGHYWLQVDWSASQNVSSNTSVITATIKLWNDYRLSIGSKSGSISINGKNYSFTSSSINSTGWHTLGKVTSDSISHNSDGSKSITISCTWNIQATISGHYYSSMSTSANIALNTIPRASSITSIDGNTIGSPITVHISRASSSFTHKVYYNLINIKNKLVGNNVGTSCTFTPPLSDCNQIPNSKYGVGSIRVDTYNGSTKIGSVTLDRNFWAPGVVSPTLKTFDVELDNSNNATVQSWGVGVVGYSKAHLTGTAEGSYSSTIKNFKISGGIDQTINSSSLNYTTPTINQIGDITYSCQAVDSRTRTSNILSGTINILPYSSPMINYISSGRDSSNNKKVHVEFQYSYSSVDKHNQATVKLLYKKKNETLWTEYPEAITGLSTESEDRIVVQASSLLENDFDETSSYTFSLQITDSLGEKSEATSLISTIEVLMDFRAGGKGLGIGKVAESDALEIDLDSKFYKPIYIKDDNGDFETLESFVNRNSRVPIFIQQGSNLDGFTVCGTFAGYNSNITNSPTTIKANYILEVSKFSNADSITFQRFTLNASTGLKCYERVCMDGSFSDWVVVYSAHRQALWTGCERMVATKTIILPEGISEQPHGIVLQWQMAADGETNPYGDSSYQFIYKGSTGTFVHDSGTVVFSTNCRKRIEVVNDTTIKGTEYNTYGGTAGGITYTNNRLVLVAIYSW